MTRRTKTHPVTMIGAFITALGINSYAYYQSELNTLDFRNDVEQAANNLLRRKVNVGNPLVTMDGRSIGYVGSVKGNTIVVPLYTDTLPLKQKFDMWMGALSCDLQGRASGHGMILYIDRRYGGQRLEVNQYCAPPRYAFTKSFLTASIQP